MTAKVYAVAQSVPAECDYLTAGKRYEVALDCGAQFGIIDDYGMPRLTYWHCSGLLGGLDWTRIEAEEPAAEAPADATIAALREALSALLLRDERNTCQHEDTYRGGSIWEICHACGMKWADDEGGKPEWQDPSEWVNARATLEGVRQ